MFEHQVGRRERLNNGSALFFGASRSSDDLRQERKRFFVCAEIGRIEQRIGGKNADKRDVGEIQPFGYHLRAEQYVVFAAGERGKNLIAAVLAAYCVSVHAQHTEFGKQRFYLAFGALCAVTRIFERF